MGSTLARRRFKTVALPKSNLNAKEIIMVFHKINLTIMSTIINERYIIVGPTFGKN